MSKNGPPSWLNPLLNQHEAISTMSTRHLGLVIACAALLTTLLAIGSMQADAYRSSTRNLAQRSETQPAAGLRLIESSSRGIVLALDTSTYSLQPETIGSSLYHTISVPGLAPGGRPGQPALPVKSVLLGIPAGVDVEVKVLGTDTEILPGDYRIAPVAHGIVSEWAGWPNLIDQGLVENPAIYDRDAFYPAAPAQVMAIGYVRDQRVARLALYPFQFNPESGQLLYSRHLTVSLRFMGEAMSATEIEAGSGQGHFEPVLANTLLNYESARPWRADPTDRSAPQTPVLVNEGAACKIDVEVDGIYEITYGDLQASGCDIGAVDPRNLQMHNQGQEIAITVMAADDASFDEGDAVRFYGQGLDTKYSSTNVYWLTTASSPGLRMLETDGYPSDPVPVAEAFSTTVHIEEDHIYWPASSPTSGRDYWFWERLTAAPGAPITRTYMISLPYKAAGTFTATLRVGLKSRYNEPYYDPDHHLQLHLNGELVEDTNWDGERVRLLAVDLPQDSLQDGVNTLQVVLPGDLGVPSDSIYTDWFELDYYRRYESDGARLAFSSDANGERRFEIGGFSTSEIALLDISQPALPRQVVSTTVVPVGDVFALQFQATITAPRHYLALTEEQIGEPAGISLDTPSDLHSTLNSADYLIITHADFDAAAQTLADYRASQGLEVAIVDVQDIYDEFGYGIFDPDAIHRFLAYTYAHWQEPAPSYVLLMGDGNLDFHDNMGIGEVNFVPPYLDQVDPWLGETASDNRYVTVSGEDTLPDMHIGRLPVSSPAGASALVSKLISYEQAPFPAPWQEQVLFVADNADSSGDFAAHSEHMVGYLPDSTDVERVYYGITYTVPSEATDAILGEINEGRLMVNYVGHGAVQFWAGEHLLDLEDIGSLTNADRLPLMLPWTCYEGLFDYPGYPSLGESIVRAEGGGAVASWSPSGLGVPAAHDVLASGFYRAVFTDGLRTLGPATTQAKLSLWTQAPEFAELIDTYVLLGDPATNLAVPRAFSFQAYLPLVLRRNEMP